MRSERDLIFSFKAGDDAVVESDGYGEGRGWDDENDQSVNYTDAIADGRTPHVEITDDWLKKNNIGISKAEFDEAMSLGLLNNEYHHIMRFPKTIKGPAGTILKVDAENKKLIDEDGKKYSFARTGTTRISFNYGGVDFDAKLPMSTDYFFTKTSLTDELKSYGGREGLLLEIKNETERVKAESERKKLSKTLDDEKNELIKGGLKTISGRGSISKEDLAANGIKIELKLLRDMLDKGMIKPYKIFKRPVFKQRYHRGEKHGEPVESEERTELFDLKDIKKQIKENYGSEAKLNEEYQKKHNRTSYLIKKGVLKEIGQFTQKETGLTKLELKELEKKIPIKHGKRHYNKNNKEVLLFTAETIKKAVDEIGGKKVIQDSIRKKEEVASAVGSRKLTKTAATKLWKELNGRRASGNNPFSSIHYTKKKFIADMATGKFTLDEIKKVLLQDGRVLIHNDGRREQTKGMKPAEVDLFLNSIVEKNHPFYNKKLAERAEGGAKTKGAEEKIARTIKKNIKKAVATGDFSAKKIEKIIDKPKKLAKAETKVIASAVAEGASAVINEIENEVTLTIADKASRARGNEITDALKKNMAPLIREMTKDNQIKYARLVEQNRFENPREAIDNIQKSLGLTRHQYGSVRRWEGDMKRYRETGEMTPSLRDKMNRIFKAHKKGSHRNYRYWNPTQKRLIERIKTEGYRPTKAEETQLNKWWLAHRIRERAEVISRTEALRAANGGTYHMMQRMLGDNPNVLRTWIIRKDGRNRDSHYSMGNQKRRGFAEPFKSGRGALLRYPSDHRGGPAESILCRCAVSYRIMKPGESG